MPTMSISELSIHQHGPRSSMTRSRIGWVHSIGQPVLNVKPIRSRCGGPVTRCLSLHRLTDVVVIARRKIELHVIKSLGKVPNRRLRPHHLERLYDEKLHPQSGKRPLAPKTVLEIHLIIRGALNDAVRRGIVTPETSRWWLTPPKCGRSPGLNSRPGQPPNCRCFSVKPLATSCFPPCGCSPTLASAEASCSACSGRTSTSTQRSSINRGLVSVGYELHESRGKTSNSRRAIDLDPTTVQVLSAWRAWQEAERAAVGIEPAGWVFADIDGNPIHPHSFSQAFERIVAGAGVPKIRLHDVRHTHGTLLIKAGVPVKVVSERLGHGNPAFTIDTYQHVLPGMQAEAARIFEKLIASRR